MAFQALAVIGATSASAAVTCTTSGSTVTVTLAAAADAAEVQRAGTGALAGQILVNGVACVPVAIFATTTSISVTGTSGDEILTIDMFDTDGATVSWGTINWTVNLGSNTTTTPGDTLVVDNSGGDDAIDTVFGASGIDLNNDGDLDVTTTAVESFTVNGDVGVTGTADDTISGAGSTATGAAFATKLTINGNGGDDTLTGGTANDTINGGGGRDTVAGGLGDDTLDGGAELTDAVSYATSATAVTVNLTSGTATGEGLDTLTTFERIVGSPLGDTLTGSAIANRITPGAGDDKVDGAGGTDVVSYSNSTAAVTVDLDAGTATGFGNDTLTSIEGAIGSSFGDTFVDDITGDNTYAGGDGNDMFDQGDDPSTGDADAIAGEGGIDTVDYSARTESITVTLNSAVNPTAGADPCELGTEAVCADGDQGAGEADDVQTVENANLGTGDDTFVGTDFSNVVQPGGGANSLDGKGGGDTLDYSAGYDAGVVINLGGGVGTDAIVGGTFENVIGTSFKDNITGTDGSNVLRAGGGKDSVRAGSGDDTVRGGKGDDALRGGGGDDDLFGGPGNDFLSGGGGDDLCKGGPGKDSLKGCEIH